MTQNFLSSKLAPLAARQSHSALRTASRFEDPAARRRFAQASGDGGG
jgi:hypothetical protein